MRYFKFGLEMNNIFLLTSFFIFFLLTKGLGFGLAGWGSGPGSSFVLRYLKLLRVATGGALSSGYGESGFGGFQPRGSGHTFKPDVPVLGREARVWYGLFLRWPS